MSITAKVSVVIPCYRCVHTLERAVASVARQTLLPQEVLLVDDGSGDNTLPFILQLQKKYDHEWIRILPLKCNKGAATARNTGWEEARGHYIAFLDADDAWHPRKIEMQVKFMDMHPNIAVSGHGYRQVSEIPNKWDEIGHISYSPVSNLYVVLKNPFVTPSFMVRRDLEIRFSPGRRYMEDHFFLMEVSAAGLEIAKIKATLVYIFKPIFGDSGLSADIWQMQRGEIENYRLLHQKAHISGLSLIVLFIYSWIKFLRRCLLVGFRNWVKS